MEIEKWAPVVGFEGRYEVSDHGQVRSLPRRIQQLSRGGNMFERTFPGKILKQVVHSDSGYPYVGLYRQTGPAVSRTVHTLVLDAFVGPCPSGQLARHLDGNPANNLLSNLLWGTHSENCYDTIRHGRNPRSNQVTCGRGHALAGSNLIPSTAKKGYRGCLSCVQATTIAWRIRDTFASHDEREAYIQAEADRRFAAGPVSRPPGQIERCRRAGHEYTEENTYRDGKEYRRCIQCAHDKYVKRARLRKAARVARGRLAISGHTPVPGDAGWVCKCGKPLGATRRVAAEAMPAHRAELVTA